MTQARMIKLSFRFEQDVDGFYNAFCEPLGTVSCGKTEEEAWTMIKDAVEVELDGLIASGTMETVFRERGVESVLIDMAEDRPREVRKVFKTERIEGVTQVPAYA